MVINPIIYAELGMGFDHRIEDLDAALPGRIERETRQAHLRRRAGEYRSTWADLEPRTKASYAHILRKHLLPRFGQAKVSAVTTDAVQRYVNELAGGNGVGAIPTLLCRHFLRLSSGSDPVPADGTRST